MLNLSDKTELDYPHVKQYLVNWLTDYALKSHQAGYVIGVSGGIDSAVCSSLCAHTGLPLIVLIMPIHQESDQLQRSLEHVAWLCDKFSNVTAITIDLTSLYEQQVALLEKSGALNNITPEEQFLVTANIRSRLRMVTLYGVAGANKSLVCGTGNKIEDYGVGFFTKFGDGGVDVSPIGDLVKSEVYALGRELGVNEAILQARPTDGLWSDGRTDEDQIGASYDELEWALDYCERHQIKSNEEVQSIGLLDKDLSAREQVVLNIYWSRHIANQHKMNLPPVAYLK